MKPWIQKHQLLSFFALTYLIAFGTTFAVISLHLGKAAQPWSWDWFLNGCSPTISAIVISGIIGGKTEIVRVLSGFTRWKVGFR